MSPAHSRRRFAPALAVAAVMLGACGRPDVPPSVPTVAVAMEDYRFTFDPVVPSGRVLFEVTNEGQVEHNLTLIRIPNALDVSLAEQVGGATRRSFPPLAVVRDRRPGASDRFAVDLQPGRYGLICIARDPDGTSHASRGMTAEFDVSSPT